MCGMGVTSSTAVTSRPEVMSARSAVSRPRPTPLTRTRIDRTPAAPLNFIHWGVGVGGQEQGRGREGGACVCVGGGG